MGGLFGGPKPNKLLEQSQLQEQSILAKREQIANADAESRRRAILAAQSGRRTGLLNAIAGSGVTRQLGGG